MYTASLNVHWESWQAHVKLPSAVEQSSHLSVFNLILNIPGCREISGLCVPEPGEQPETPWLLMPPHWLTAASNIGPPLQIVLHLGSSLPVHSVGSRTLVGRRPPVGFILVICEGPDCVHEFGMIALGQ